MSFYIFYVLSFGNTELGFVNDFNSFVDMYLSNFDLLQSITLEFLIFLVSLFCININLEQILPFF
jgi:hypothetical protein